MMDVGAYLKRIGYRGSRDPGAETLKALHLAHLYSVPFENLSIHAGEPIVLDGAALFAKIVGRRRGGFCYELNGLFALLLRNLGFRVNLLSAGVARPNGGFGPEFDHLTLLVMLDERWLADVGFGDSFHEPLLLDRTEVQAQGDDAFRIVYEEPYFKLMRCDGKGVWQPQYRFTHQAHNLSDFEGMNRYHQTSPRSHFTQKRNCSRALPGGRVTLSDTRLILTRGDRKEERPIPNLETYTRLLNRHFHMAIPADLDPFQPIEPT